MSALVLISSTSTARAEVGIDWVEVNWVYVGDPGNACDGPLITTCRGAIPYEYWIGRFEVTNAQYTEFLNAVAATDTNGLYDAKLSDVNAPNFGGIVRSGVSGDFVYAVIPGRENKPVHPVPFLAAIRFANWLHNGQPIGPQSDPTTEDGAYKLPPLVNLIRSKDARVFLPREDEWYKAAFYDTVERIYFGWPAGLRYSLYDLATSLGLVVRSARFRQVREPVAVSSGESSPRPATRG